MFEPLIPNMYLVSLQHVGFRDEAGFMDILIWKLEWKF